MAHADANIIFGTVVDENLSDEIRVTVIAAGFDRYEETNGANGAVPDDLFAPARPTIDLTPQASTAPPVAAPAVDRSMPVEDDDETIDLFGGEEDDLDDEFDVPSFLK